MEGVFVFSLVFSQKHTRDGQRVTLIEGERKMEMETETET